MSAPTISDESELRRCGVCRARIPFDEAQRSNWATKLSQVTPLNLAVEDGEYAFYRNILEEPGFPFDSILQSEIGKTIERYFAPLNEIRLDDAFCVHYNPTMDDTTGAKHTDPSDITVNMCLEKTNDVDGSEVKFYGTKELRGESTELGPEEFLVEQKAGFATIHWGSHPHETMTLKCGRRTNIVLTYCYRDASKSAASTKYCYS